MLKRFLKLRFILLFLTGLISFYFTIQAVRIGYQYVRLDSQTSAENVTWEVVMRSASHYILAAHYTYHVKGQEYQGKTECKTPFYFNYYAAIREVQSRKNEKFFTWYQKSRPSFSALQKQFPKKECIYALLTFGVFVYFYLVRSLLKSFSDTFSKLSG